MHPREFIMELKVVHNVVSDNFYFDYKAVRLNLTELFFQSLLNKLKLKLLRAIRARIFLEFEQVSCLYSKMQHLTLSSPPIQAFALLWETQ